MATLISKFKSLVLNLLSLNKDSDSAWDSYRKAKVLATVTINENSLSAKRRN